MNDKIKAIALESGFIEPFLKDTEIDWSSTHNYDKNLEMFAMLIINKCANLAQGDRGAGDYLDHRTAAKKKY